MIILAFILGSISTIALLTSTCCYIACDDKQMNDLVLLYSAVGCLITVLITSYVNFEISIYLGVLYLIIYTLIYGYKLLAYIGRYFITE